MPLLPQWDPASIIKAPLFYLGGGKTLKLKNQHWHGSEAALEGQKRCSGACSLETAGLGWLIIIINNNNNIFLCYSSTSNNAWDIRQSQNKVVDAYSIIQKEEPLFLPRWYSQSWLLALSWGCLYIPCSSRCLSQMWIYALAIRASAGNYASGVSLWSHLVWASQLISLHLSFSACETDNNVGTTQCGLIEVLASPWLRGLQGYDVDFYLRQSKMLSADWRSLYLLNAQQLASTPGIPRVTS